MKITTTGRVEKLLSVECGEGVPESRVSQRKYQILVIAQAILSCGHNFSKREVVRKRTRAEKNLLFSGTLESFGESCISILAAEDGDVIFINNKGIVVVN